MLTSTYETTARRPASTGGAPPRAPRLGGPHVVSEPLTHEQPRSVDARLDRRQADPERLGDVGVREPLDVVQDERGSVVGGKAVDRLGQGVAQLTLQSHLVHAPGPVVHRLEVSRILQTYYKIVHAHNVSN